MCSEPCEENQIPLRHKMIIATYRAIIRHKVMNNSIVHKI